jgi:hypothetical protein
VEGVNSCQCQLPVELPVEYSPNPETASYSKFASRGVEFAVTDNWELTLATRSSKIFHLDQVKSSGWGGAVCLGFSRLVKQLGDPAVFRSS